MLMILARLVRSESFWAVVKVRSPHTGPEVCYIIRRLGRIRDSHPPAKWLRRLYDSHHAAGRMAGTQPSQPSAGGWLHWLEGSQNGACLQGGVARIL